MEELTPEEIALAEISFKRWKELEGKFTEREWKEIEFAITYAEHFDHGTDGHHRLRLISKLYFMVAEKHLED